VTSDAIDRDDGRTSQWYRSVAAVNRRATSADNLVCNRDVGRRRLIHLELLIIDCLAAAVTDTDWRMADVAERVMYYTSRSLAARPSNRIHRNVPS